MKATVRGFISLCGVSSLFCFSMAAGAAEDFTAHAWQLESKGDAVQARDYLQRAAQTGAPDAQMAYAQFLDRHGDPAAREAYQK
ncbi:MAG: hypothetical protein JOZ32_07770, partial [Bryobacterales bacterium]|nr:hypothetical protein [Bryobacterales bacterium]